MGFPTFCRSPVLHRVLAPGPSAVVVAAMAALVMTAATAETESGAEPAMSEIVLALPLGDPARRERQFPIVAGAITDSRQGDRLDPDGLAARLAPVRLLFMGEEHTSMDDHRAQLALVQALHRAGRRVVVALEMYPWSRQPELDRWTAGAFSSDEAFLDASGWYETWGYRWEYYRDLFHFARDQRLVMVAVNAPRDLVKRVRLEGLETLGASLSADERSRLPPAVNLDSAEHRRLFAAYMGVSADSHAGSQLDGMFAAQATWDAVMGWSSLRALTARPGSATIVVVLLGSGHVAYGLGAPRQLAGQLPPGALATLIPVPVPAGAPLQVQATYADFIWGLPPPGPTVYPELGISLAGPPATATNRIIQLTPGSPAARAGVQVGDLVEAIGDRPVRRAADLRRGMAGTRWGDTVRLRVRQSRPAPAASGNGPGPGSDGAAIELAVPLTLTDSKPAPPGELP